MPTQKIAATRQVNPTGLVGDLKSDGSTLSVLKHNRSAVGGPTSGDNFAAGYAIGSTWIYGTAYYLCTGDGVWTQINSSTGTADYRRVKVNVATTSTSTTPAQIAWVADDSFGSGVVVNGNGLQVLSDGIYLITCFGSVESTVAGDQIAIQVQGSLNINVVSAVAANTRYPFSISYTADLLAGTTVFAEISRSSGSGTVSVSNTQTKFCITKLISGNYQGPGVAKLANFDVLTLNGQFLFPRDISRNTNVFIPNGDSTSIVDSYEGNIFATVGTLTGRATASTNVRSRSKRIGLVSAATAGSLATIRPATGQFRTNDGDQGFFGAIMFSISDATSGVSNPRMFVGWSLGSSLTNVEYNTLTNAIGVIQLATDTTQLYYYSAGASAATAQALGVTNFPAAWNSNNLYMVCAHFPPAGSSLGGGWLQIYNLSNNTNSGLVDITSNRPVNSTYIGPAITRGNNTAAVACGVDVHAIYTTSLGR